MITLIMLAVISTLAIAFLGLTQRETGSVDAMSRTTDAEVAADSALERAKAEIAAVYPVRNQDVAANGPNIMGPDMMVSVCCQDYDFANRRTIPYDRLNPAERLAKRFDSAPPVFVQTSATVTANSPLDDRFFLDLNRNGVFEDTGYVLDTTDAPAGPGRFQTNNLVTWRIGDPQWYGILQNPRRPHTNNNRFIGRYAFMVLPAGKSLDVNWIHNDSKRDAEPGAGEAWFTREQGLGGFEVNLAALLTDLNGNTWGGYRFQPSTFPNLPSTGVAFADAWQFVRARYDGAKVSPDRTLSALFQPLPVAMTQDLIDREGIDLFARGLGNYTGTEAGFSPWPASDGPHHMFSVHDLFNANALPKLPAAAALPGFSERLRDTSLPGNSYDRYTFYRMLAQMGTDSVAEDDDEQGKIHLNYVNIRSWVPNSSFRYRPTDLVSWTNVSGQFVNDMGRPGPELFFLSVVTNLLMREFPFAGLVETNTSPTWSMDTPLSIPIYTNGSRFWLSNTFNYGPLYSARIHQILQQAANIYDATRPTDGGFVYPTVFRPQFRTDGDEVRIVNYVMVDEVSEPSPVTSIMFPANAARAWVDLDAGGKPGVDNGVYNIPLIVGARKGFPNFNEFHSRLVAKAVRRLIVEKPADQDSLANARIFEDFSLLVTNQHSFEAWNSYTNRYTNNLSLYYSNQVTVGIRGSVANAPIAIPPVFTGTNFFPPVYAGTWPGNTFVTPQVATHLVVSHTNYALADAGGFTNQWDIVVTNRIRFFLVDNNRIIGAVALSLTNGVFDIGNGLAENDVSVGALSPLRNLWNRRKQGNWTQGIQSQLSISKNPDATGNNDWTDFGDFVESKTKAIQKFNHFIELRTNVVTTAQVPFTAVRSMIHTNTWSVNDPLVHCTPDDLDRSFAGAILKPSQFSQIGNSIGARNLNYKPWGGADPGNLLAGEMDPSLKDPGVSSSDYWNFPASKFPTIGWLGRVHRGTPWQTIYLKSDRIGGSVQDWRTIAGVKSGRISSRGAFYADSIHPTNDWRLLDIFTTAIHPNVTRGRLSINQTNLAAWSAVLSGVTASAITNQSNGGVDVSVPVSAIVEPAWFTNTVPVILDGINRTRSSRPNREFSKLSDLMAVPELSYDSPILGAHGFNARQPIGNVDVDDSDYERLPEQILGLLKVGEPRFVIYAWGQSLKPARLGFKSINEALDGPSIDPVDKMVNNYQVTGEVATRAVVRVVFPERESNNPSDPGYFRIDYKRPRLVVESFNIIDLE